MGRLTRQDRCSAGGSGFGLVAIVLVVTVASASFNAALYWFAVTGESPGGFSAGDLQAAYRPNTRRAGAFGS